MQDLGNGRLDAFVGVGDHELDPAQAAPGKLAQKLGPERLGFGRSDIHAEHFATAVAIDRDCDNYRRRHNPPALPHLHVGGVNPQIGPIAFDRPAQERFDPGVDLLAQPADLAFGDAAHAHGLDQIVD